MRLPLGAQRLLALLAVREGGISRGVAAEELWPGSRRGRAGANLRAALSQGKKIGSFDLIGEFDAKLHLVDSAEVDLQSASREARAVIDASRSWHDDTAARQIVSILSRELLPAWFDDWLIIERELWNEIRLHALEALARQLLEAGRSLSALEAALAAAAIEPVRESPHRIIMEIYIDEGNAGCALKHYQRYRRLLQRELCAAPSQRMDHLIDGLQSI
jgi:DNA-binding SARP family transcriptional activator